MSGSRGTTRRYEFRVGLLIVAGMIATVVLVLMSDRISFDSYYRVTAFLEEAGGLRSGSHVELAGIPIGSVVSVRAADDTRGDIRAELSINSEYDLYESNRLTVATKGILGDTFLSFSGTGDEDRGEPLPKDGTAVVQAVPGFFDEIKRQGEEIVAGIRDILDDETRGHTKSIIADTSRFMGNLADASSRFDGLLARTDRTLANVDELTTDLRGHGNQLSDSSVQLMEDTRETLADLRSTLGNLEQQTAAMLESGTVTIVAAQRALETGRSLLQRVETQLREGGDVAASMAAVRETASVLARLAQDVAAGRGLVGQLLTSEDLVRDVNTSAINITELTESIAEHPEVLIWGQDNEQAAEARLRRQQLRERRAFAQGYQNARHGEVKEGLPEEESGEAEE